MLVIVTDVTRSDLPMEPILSNKNWLSVLRVSVSLSTFLLAAIITIIGYESLHQGHVSVYLTQFTSFTKHVSPTRMQGLLYDHESHEDVSAFQVKNGSDMSHFGNATECVTDSWADIRCRSSKIPLLYHSENGVNGLTFTAIHPLFLMTSIMSITASYSLLAFFMEAVFVSEYFNMLAQMALLTAWHLVALILQLLCYFNITPFQLAGDIPTGNYIIILLILLFSSFYQVKMLIDREQSKEKFKDIMDGQFKDIIDVELLVTVPLTVLAMVALGPQGVQQWRIQSLYITTYVFLSAFVLANRIHALHDAMDSGHYIWMPILVMSASLVLFFLLVEEPIRVATWNDQVIPANVYSGYVGLCMGICVAAGSLLVMIVEYGLSTSYGPKRNELESFSTVRALFTPTARVICIIVFTLVYYASVKVGHY
jgi:hypothetical protein